jgi:uncharacterized protein YdeI (YjbR/CyaY-like superfamily)
MNKDKKVDEYIDKSAEFAKPVLNHLRRLIHTTCPNVQETIKWRMPFYEYKGLLCNMAAFKQHCVLGFWKAALMKDAKEMKENNSIAMGNLGKIKSIADLPPDKIIISRIKEAMKLNEQGIKLPERNIAAKKSEIVVPFFFNKELIKYKKASHTFTNLSLSQKKEYIEWIEEAKTEETKNKRIDTSIEWLTEGKTRNWKYEKK